MSAATVPRLRMFAGPNDSGKSTLIRKLQSLVLRPGLLGVYLNADDIECHIRRTGTVDLSRFGIVGSADAMPMPSSHFF